MHCPKQGFCRRIPSDSPQVTANPVFKEVQVSDTNGTFLTAQTIQNDQRKVTGEVFRVVAVSPLQRRFLLLLSFSQNASPKSNVAHSARMVHGGLNFRRGRIVGTQFRARLTGERDRRGGTNEIAPYFYPYLSWIR